MSSINLGFSSLLSKDIALPSTISGVGGESGGVLSIASKADSQPAETLHFVLPSNTFSNVSNLPSNHPIHLVALKVDS